MKSRNRAIVYSTDHGRMCPECSNPTASCTCGQRQTAPAGDFIVRIGRQTKGRKGKGVTTISDVPLQAEDLKKLAKELKKKCGCGGAVKNGVIEIQGDHRSLLLDILSKRWQTKLSGG